MDEKLVTVCAVQLNLRYCSNWYDFFNLLDKNVFSKFAKLPDLVVFPENINLCLFFHKFQPIQSLSIRNWLEKLFDKIITNLNLSFLLRTQSLYSQKDIIISAYSYLARKYKCNIISGSFYEKREDGIYNVIYAFDKNGKVVDSACKSKLIGFEKALKIKSKSENKVASFDFGKVGLCICFDINDPEYVSKFDCDVLVAPSNGFRPFPGYPFDKNSETPQIQRALENKIAVIRPYCAGWLFPLYFAGRTMIVDKNGKITKSKNTNKTELVFANIYI